MVKWVRLSAHQYLGFFALGLALLALQELPYLVMSFIPMQHSPLMEMQDRSALLNGIEKVLGVACILTMLFVVRDDATGFSLGTPGRAAFLWLAAAALLGYYIGWGLYFTGHQGLAVVLGLLVAMPPLYYAFIGLWRGNWVLAGLGGAFLCAHLANVWNNLK